MDGQSGNASYNSLQVALKKRLSYGVNLNVAYTWSKSIDDYPSGGGNADIGSDSVSVMPWYFRNGRVLDRGPSGSDRRHRLVLSYVWMLPLLSHANPLVRGAVGGWQLNGITTVQSGGAMTVTAGFELLHAYVRTSPSGSEAVAPSMSAVRHEDAYGPPASHEGAALTA